MSLITTEGEAKYYALADKSGKIVDSGIIPAGAVMACGLTVVSAQEDANKFLSELNTHGVDGLDALPRKGDLVEAGSMYAWNNQAVIVRKTHVRTDATPDSEPDKFIMFSSENSGELPWVPGEKVVVGTIRTYDGKDYVCIQEHTTESTWEPPETPALWKIPSKPKDGVWTEGVFYAKGTKVTYGQDTYICVLPHTSQSDWTPPNTLTLWTKVVSSENWAAGVAYSVGDVVIYSGKSYKCLQAHTSILGWEPPKVPALWKLIGG